MNLNFRSTTSEKNVNSATDMSDASTSALNSRVEESVVFMSSSMEGAVRGETGGSLDEIYSFTNLQTEQNGSGLHPTID